MTSGYSSSHSNSHTNSYSSSHGNSHSNSHTNHGNHANTVSSSGSLAPAHTVSAGSTSITELEGHLGLYGSSGMLDSLIKAATEARNSLNSPRSVSAPALSTFATPSGLSDLLQYSGGSHTIYNYSNGININITYNNNGSSGHANTGGTISNSPTSKIASKNIHCNTTGGVNIHCNTSSSTWQNAVYSKSLPETNISVSSGSHITKNTLINVLNTINHGKITSKFTVPSFNASGDTKYTYQNSHSNSHSSSHTNSYSNSYSSSHTNSSTSSKKFKYGIKPFDGNALSLIKDLNIVEFRYIKEYDDPNILHYGFIAEDTSEVFSTKYHDRMDYTNCIGILLKAIQELEKELNELKSSK